MKRIGGLFDSVVRFDNLLAAARKAALGKRDRPAVARFLFHLEPELLRLEAELKSGEYRPGDFHVFEVFDPKRRRISEAPFRDRVVHHAVCNLTEPWFERRMIFDTYACRPGKGTHAAIERAQGFARRYPFALQCDVRKYFETVDHAVLKGLLRRLFKEPELFGLLDRIIDHQPPYTEPGRGLPIGNLTSQHFANLYLGELDHHLKERLRIKGYVRYMDDLLLFGADKAQLFEALMEIRDFLGTRLKLALKEGSIRVAPVTEGIPFLGFRVFPQTVRLNQRTLHRLRRKLRGVERAYLKGRIGERELVGTGSSLIAHVAHADSLGLRRRLIRDSLIPG